MQRNLHVFILRGLFVCLFVLPSLTATAFTLELEVLPEEVLLEEVSADVSSAQVPDFTVWPDVLHAEDSGARNVGILLGLDHDDETGVHRD